jgi:uncharacterized membrane protein YfbV (UPF0208 family)
MSLGKKWMSPSVSQLKNRWYHELRRRLHETGTDIEMLTKVLAHGRKVLPIPVLTKG